MLKSSINQVKLFTLAVFALHLGACSLSQIKKDVAAEEAPTSEPAIAASPVCKPDQPIDEIPALAAPDVWERVRSGFTLEPVSNKSIDQQRRWFLKHPNYISRVVNRSEPYIFHIVEKLEARNIPMEIALLPIVESAFDPFAYSHGRASGMWQFIPGTGKMLGLKQNWWYDGRRDIPSSTDAAITYLEQLNKRFKGDWLLALAAYNSGAGNVSKAIRKNKKRGKPTDYWHLDLPRETEHYVPKLMALVEIFKEPAKFDISLKPIPNEPYFGIVDTEAQIDLAHAAELADIDMKTLYMLNPAFNRWATDPQGPHRLLVPLEKQSVFEENLANIPADERVVWKRYKIKSGDTLSGIAKKHKVSTTVLKEANDIKGSFLRAGKNLMVPIAAEGHTHYIASIEQRLQKTHSRASKRNKGKRIDYKVVSGDSLWTIANRYGVSTRSIARWNNMAPKDTIRPGQVLAIWPASRSLPKNTASSSSNTVRKVSYRVKNGDSLSRIASKFRLTVKDIMRWNGLSPKKYLQPGQSLTLFVDVTRYDT